MDIDKICLVYGVSVPVSILSAFWLLRPKSRAAFVVTVISLFCTVCCFDFLSLMILLVHGTRQSAASSSIRGMFSPLSFYCLSVFVLWPVPSRLADSRAMEMAMAHNLKP